MIESDLNPRHALDVNERDHHVFPTDDLIVHEISRDCVCRPDVEPARPGTGQNAGVVVLVWRHRPLIEGSL